MSSRAQPSNDKAPSVAAPGALENNTHNHEGANMNTNNHQKGDTMNTTTHHAFQQQSIIPTFMGELTGHVQPLVDARDLHKHLDVTSRFNDWIANRIKQYGFIEGEDFCYYNLSSRENQTLSGRFGNLLAGSNRRDHHLSLEMAKELALVENNARGRQIRRGLIAMEREVRERLPQLLDENAALKRLVLTTSPELGNLIRYREMGLSMVEIGKLQNKSANAVRHQFKRFARLGLMDYTPNPRLSAAGMKGQQTRQLNLLSGGDA